MSLTTDVEENEKQRLRQIISKKLPSSTIIDESGGNIVIGVPYTQMRELNNFFKYIFLF